jgi:Glycosyl hydrolase family 3 N terminal domain
MLLYLLAIVLSLWSVGAFNGVDKGTSNSGDVLIRDPFWSRASQFNKTAFIDDLISKLTVEELIHQVHLTFADNVVGPLSQNELYGAYVGNAGVGVIHDWYPTNKSQFNDLQKLNLERMRVPIPFLHTGECLHGVGSQEQTVFPQQIAMAATFDPSLMNRVGGAIGAEARSVGIHACFSPVLDLGKDTRWGRTQEGLGMYAHTYACIGHCWRR